MVLWGRGEGSGHAITNCLRDEKSLHRHTIPSFPSSKWPFWLQLRSRETPHVSHLETEAELCLRRLQRRATRAAWVRCEPFTHRRDLRKDELASSSRRRAQPFLLNHCSSEHNRECLPGLLWSSSREGVTRSVQASRWARTRNFSRSANLVPNSNGSGPSPPSSHTAHWEGPKRSPLLVPDIVLSEDVNGHWPQKGYEGPYGIHRQTVPRPSAYVDVSLGIWLEARKNPTHLSSPRCVTRQGSAQVCKSFSEPVAHQIRHT